MGKYFGTDGFRGEAGVNLTADHAYKVGRFLGWYYNALRERSGNNEPARIVIGKDTRRSSYMFEYSLVAGLTASGADAYLLHVTTFPARRASCWVRGPMPGPISSTPVCRSAPLAAAISSGTQLSMRKFCPMDLEKRKP